MQATVTLALVGLACQPCQPVAAPVSGGPAAAPVASHPGGHASAAAVADPTAIEFSVELARPDARAGSRVKVRLKLRNVSQHWLWVNYGFGPSHSNKKGPVWFQVNDEDTGKSLDWHCSEATPASPPELRYVLLAPGDEYSTVNSLECFLPGRRAKVRVTAHYRDNTPMAPAPPAFARNFTAELVSKTLIVESPDYDTFFATTPANPPSP